MVLLLSRLERVRSLRATTPPTPWRKIAVELKINNRTLAPADAWTHASGYRSDRALEMLTIHKTKGERGRATVFFEQAMEVAA